MKTVLLLGMPGGWELLIIVFLIGIPWLIGFYQIMKWIGKKLG